MELVYLWVEEYKNIKNQGFRFSPRFECEFDGENLTITENKDYVSIFPKNINITAIVGENGSGKSSLYELLFNLIHNVEIQNPNSLNFIVTFDKKENQYFINNKKNLDININGEKNQCRISTDDNYLLLLLDLVYSPWNIVNSKNKTTYKENYALEPSRILSNSSLANKMDINGFDSNLKSFGFYGYMYLKNSSIQNDFSKKLKELKNVRIEERTDDKIRRLKEFMILITINEKAIKEFQLYFPININISHIKTIYKEFEVYEQNFKTKKDIKESFKKFMEEHENYESDLINNLNAFNIAIIPTLNENINNITKIYNNCKNLYLLFSLYNFEIIFVDNSKFKDLSSGQSTLLSYIGYLARYIKYCQNSNKKSCTIIIDECETSLHPNWQKQTVKFFLDSIRNEVSTNFEINLIFISHSPFILSDIPKDNVIFLDKFDDKETEIIYPKLKINGLENGNCINVSEYMELKTFGANIHTLLSDGFFMSGGLMGEFAKNKITKILRFLNDDNKFIDLSRNTKIPFLIPENYLAKNLKPIIKSIGEDFLRNKLLNLYRNKFIKDEKEKEKLILKNKINELQKQYDELNK